MKMPLSGERLAQYYASSLLLNRHLRHDCDDQRHNNQTNYNLSRRQRPARISPPPPPPSSSPRRWLDLVLVKWQWAWWRWWWHCHSLDKNHNDSDKSLRSTPGLLLPDDSTECTCRLSPLLKVLRLFLLLLLLDISLSASQDSLTSFCPPSSYFCPLSF